MLGPGAQLSVACVACVAVVAALRPVPSLCFLPIYQYFRKKDRRWSSLVFPAHGPAGV
jgi:hypothetical protein